MERLPHGLVDHLPPLCPRAGSLPATVLPGVIALTGHAQQACHAGDLVVRLLRVHQLEPFLRGGFDAKKAAAFPKNALSASSSWTRRRRLFSSSRSVAANGASGPGAGPRRSRSCWTQRPSSCAPTSISSATCAIGRSVSSTRAAASRRYSGVYLFRFAITTTLPQVSTTRHLRRQHQEGKPRAPCRGPGRVAGERCNVVVMPAWHPDFAEVDAPGAHRSRMTSTELCEVAGKRVDNNSIAELACGIGARARPLGHGSAQGGLADGADDLL